MFKLQPWLLWPLPPNHPPNSTVECFKMILKLLSQQLNLKTAKVVVEEVAVVEEEEEEVEEVKEEEARNGARTSGAI